MVIDERKVALLPLVHSTAELMRGNLDTLAGEVTEVIHHACPDLPSRLQDDTFASTRSNLDAFTTIVRDSIDPDTFPPPGQARAYAQVFAREGLDVELLTRAYRHGEFAYRQLWRQQLAINASESEAYNAATMQVEDWLFRYISAVTRSLAVQHAEEQARRSSSASVFRLNEVRKVLSGDQVDQASSSQRLRYRLDGSHVAFVIWHESGATETQDSLEELSRLALAISSALGATNTLSLAIDDVYAGWANVSDPSGPLNVALPAGIQAAYSMSHRGLDGFRRTHQEALRARRVARLGDARSAPVYFGDLALDSLLTSDLDEAVRFVERELGELADGSGPRQKIVDTLEAYLLAGSSLARVSRQLGVHENTVAYRIRRAEEMLGRPVDAHQLELQSALRLARLLRPGN